MGLIASAARVAAATGLLLCASSFAGAAVKDKGPPTRNGVYIGYGQCPASSCAANLKWRLLERTPIFAAENSIRLMGWAPKCATVTTISGEHLIIPRRGKIIKASQGFAVGDVVYVLESEGEGDVDFWRNGRLESGRLPDEDSDIDWDGYGKPIPPDVWWEKVRLPDGRVGWLRDPGNIDEVGDDPTCKAAKP